MSRVLGLVLGALVLTLALLPPAVPADQPTELPDAGPQRPLVAALDLFLPGLFTPVETSVVRFNVRNPWADALGLPTPPDSELVPLHVGYTALLLALVALVFARGPIGWAGRGAIAAGLLLLAFGGAPGLWAAGRLLLLAGLAALAGCQLRDLGLREETEDRGQAPLALGGLSVLCTAALALAALRSGRESDYVVAQPAMQRFVELIPDNFVGLQPREVMAAGALRLASDRAALACFAAMTALLLHLKSRSRETALLVLAVAAAELLLPRWIL